MSGYRGAGEIETNKFDTAILLALSAPVQSPDSFVVARNGLLGLCDVGRTPLSQPDTGQFFSDLGATVDRLERVLVGGARANLATSNGGASAQDWLSEIMASTSVGAWLTFNAQSASLTENGGSIGHLGAAQTLTSQAAIGLVGIGISNNLAQQGRSAWGGYFEGWVVNSQVTPSFAIEAEGLNLAGPLGEAPTPYMVNVGGGVSAAQLGSGGEHASGTYDIASFISTVNNPSKALVGIVFGADSLTGTNGNDTGNAVAIAMAKNHTLSWSTPETPAGQFQGANPGFRILSTVTAAAQGATLLAENGALAVLNGSNNTIFSVQTGDGATNYLFVESGTSTTAAGIYVSEGSGGSPNLGLYPASGGQLQITSGVSAVGAALPTTAGAGFLQLTLNGTSVRIPCFTPPQIGS